MSEEQRLEDLHGWIVTKFVSKGKPTSAMIKIQSYLSDVNARSKGRCLT